MSSSISEDNDLNNIRKIQDSNNISSNTFQNKLKGNESKNF